MEKLEAEERKRQEAINAQMRCVQEVRNRLQEIEDQRLGQYIIRLQKVWRGKMARRKFAAMKELLLKEKLIKRKERRLRREADRKATTKAREAARREVRMKEVEVAARQIEILERARKMKAATRIQCAWRGWVARRKLEGAKYSKEQAERERRRKYRARVIEIEEEKVKKKEEEKLKQKERLKREVEKVKVLLAPMEQRLRERAAMKMQAHVRGNIARKEYQKLRESQTPLLGYKAAMRMSEEQLRIEKDALRQQEEARIRQRLGDEVDTLTKIPEAALQAELRGPRLGPEEMPIASMTGDDTMQKQGASSSTTCQECDHRIDNLRTLVQSLRAVFIAVLSMPRAQEAPEHEAISNEGLNVSAAREVLRKVSYATAVCGDIDGKFGQIAAFASQVPVLGQSGASAEDT
eukprot:TRINITY_DN37766_c0_g1_i1.p1 TRINITY_DN37766_c0_g1~~TRINITY_DN37766_c0_g1_i1.p1  ORF type:complete len:445 (-),score=130.08 TRINITY_DN37766_c0_g1_i1:906-2129(-)